MEGIRPLQSKKNLDNTTLYSGLAIVAALLIGSGYAIYYGVTLKGNLVLSIITIGIGALIIATITISFTRQYLKK